MQAGSLKALAKKLLDSLEISPKGGLKLVKNWQFSGSRATQELKKTNWLIRKLRNTQTTLSSRTQSASVSQKCQAENKNDERHQLAVRMAEVNIFRRSTNVRGVWPKTYFTCKIPPWTETQKRSQRVAYCSQIKPRTPERIPRKVCAWIDRRRVRIWAETGTASSLQLHKG